MLGAGEVPIIAAIADRSRHCGLGFGWMATPRTHRHEGVGGNARGSPVVLASAQSAVSQTNGFRHGSRSRAAAAKTEWGAAMTHAVDDAG